MLNLASLLGSQYQNSFQNRCRCPLKALMAVQKLLPILVLLLTAYRKWKDSFFYDTNLFTCFMAWDLVHHYNVSFMLQRNLCSLIMGHRVLHSFISVALLMHRSIIYMLIDFALFLYQLLLEMYSNSQYWWLCQFYYSILLSVISLKIYLLDFNITPSIFFIL